MNEFMNEIDQWVASEAAIVQQDAQDSADLVAVKRSTARAALVKQVQAIIATLKALPVAQQTWDEIFTTICQFMWQQIERIDETGTQLALDVAFEMLESMPA